MANANSTSSRTPKRAGLDLTGNNQAGRAIPMKVTPQTDQLLALKEVPPRFNTGLMERRDALLGRAGELMSQAYAALSSISAIANVVRNSQVARETEAPSLDVAAEDHILGGVVLLADLMAERLDREADYFGKKLVEGSAQ